MIRPITDTLRTIGRGEYIDRCSDELVRLVRAVEAEGKPGTLVMTIRISPANRGGALVVEGKHELKLPKTPAHDALMWPTVEGNLQTSDPAQHTLDLQQVPVRSAADGPLIKHGA